MNENRVTDALAQLYPEPTASERYDDRLARLAEDADRRRSRVRPVRTIARFATVAAAAAVVALASPRVVQAVPWPRRSCRRKPFGVLFRCRTMSASS